MYYKTACHFYTLQSNSETTCSWSFSNGLVFADYRNNLHMNIKHKEAIFLLAMKLR